MNLLTGKFLTGKFRQVDWMPAPVFKYGSKCNYFYLQHGMIPCAWHDYSSDNMCVSMDGTHLHVPYQCVVFSGMCRQSQFLLLVFQTRASNRPPVTSAHHYIICYGDVLSPNCFLGRKTRSCARTMPRSLQARVKAPNRAPVGLPVHGAARTDVPACPPHPRRSRPRP